MTFGKQPLARNSNFLAPKKNFSNFERNPESRVKWETFLWVPIYTVVLGNLQEAQRPSRLSRNCQSRKVCGTRTYTSRRQKKIKPVQIVRLLAAAGTLKDMRKKKKDGKCRKTSKIEKKGDWTNFAPYLKPSTTTMKLLCWVSLYRVSIKKPQKIPGKINLKKSVNNLITPVFSCFFLPLAPDFASGIRIALMHRTSLSLFSSSLPSKRLLV